MQRALRNLLFLAFAVLSLSLWSQTTARAAPVSEIRVNVVDTSGLTSPLLLERMTLSMQSVAEQLFLDKDAERLSASTADYARLMTEIGDRALTGYKVERVDFGFGEQTKVTIYLSAWAEVVTAVEVELNFSGVDETAAERLLLEAPHLKEKITNTLSGASLDAVDWVGSALRQLVRREIDATLPEFRASVDLSQRGKSILAQIIIYPVGQTVQNVSFELRSETVPNLLLLQAKERLRHKADALRGLPVAYVERRRPELEKGLLAEATAEKVVPLYSLKPLLTLVPGVDTIVDIRMEADKYKIWLEGYGDIGKDDGNISGRAHFGKYISDKIEIFGEGSVVLDSMEWEFAPGVAWHGGNTTVSVARRLSSHENDYRLEYSFSPKWVLRAERFSGEHINEFGIRYRVHEFLSFEYVYSNDKPYLRLIGNL